MRAFRLAYLLLLLAAAPVRAGIVITGVVDGPRSGGQPKAIELFAVTDVPDLAVWGLERAINGDPFNGADLTLSGSLAAGEFLRVAADADAFLAYFGFPAGLESGVATINGNDAVALWENGVLADVFGDPGDVADSADFTAVWAYRDSYAYRLSGAGPATIFDLADWALGGLDILDPQGSAGVNGDAGVTVPFGTFEPADDPPGGGPGGGAAVPEPGSLALFGLGLGLLALRARRRSVTAR